MKRTNWANWRQSNIIRGSKALQHWPRKQQPADDLGTSSQTNKQQPNVLKVLEHQKNTVALHGAPHRVRPVLCRGDHARIQNTHPSRASDWAGPEHSNTQFFISASSLSFWSSGCFLSTAVTHWKVEIIQLFTDDFGVSLCFSEKKRRNSSAFDSLRTKKFWKLPKFRFREEINSTNSYDCRHIPFTHSLSLCASLSLSTYLNKRLPFLSVSHWNRSDDHLWALIKNCLNCFSYLVVSNYLVEVVTSRLISIGF